MTVSVIEGELALGALERAHAPVAAPSESMAAIVRLAKLRLLQMHYEAKVGHIGSGLSCLDTLLVLYHEVLQPSDRFVLSKGHAAGALYVTLWTRGLLSDHDLNTFHRDGTMLAGHPIANWMPQIPFATGSLGHGLSLGVGLALGHRLRKEDGHIYCLTSDGEWQEGSNWEALIFAAHNRLANLTVLIDENGLQGFGSTDEVASMRSICDKFQGFAVDVVSVDGHDTDEIRASLRVPTYRPKIVVLKTVKGKGVSFMENEMAWHYLPMTQQQYATAVAQVCQA